MNQLEMNAIWLKRLQKKEDEIEKLKLKIKELEDSEFYFKKFIENVEKDTE
ncbi:hypothetical protein [Metabacillus sp. Hm71]|uniref:hypothetical protein n=1 Tax=Metabacillus sp. Hm71 TaxID=3450743 RepID=UPI003F41DA52